MAVQRLRHSLFALFTALCSTLGWADMCQITGVDHICEHLGEARREAVLQVLMAEYSLQVLTGEINDKPRTVVLLGERHIKSEWEAKAGRMMLAQFPFRGLEGVRANTLLGNLLVLPNALVLKSLYSIMGYFQDQREGSTIHEALLEGRTFSSDEFVTTSVANILLESDSYDALTVSSAYLGSATLMNVTIAPVLWGLDGYLLYKKQWLTALPLIVSQALLFSQAWPFISGIDSRAAEEYGPMPYPLLWFILPYRNQLMARNIHSSLSVNNDQSEMLVIMGSAHISGVSKILREQYGFERLPKMWEREREEWIKRKEQLDAEL